MAHRWDLTLLTISDQQTEWRLRTASPVCKEEDNWEDAESFAANTTDSAGIEEVLKDLK